MEFGVWYRWEERCFSRSRNGVESWYDWERELQEQLPMMNMDCFWFSRIGWVDIRNKLGCIYGIDWVGYTA